MKNKDGLYRRFVEKRDKRRREKSERWRNKFYDPMVIFNGVLAIGTIALAVMAYFQYLVLKKTDETLQAQQRAWLEPRNPTITSGRKKGEALNFIVRYANIGKEPAINVVIQTDVRPVDVAAAGDQANGWISGKNVMCNSSKPNENGLVIWPSDSKVHELFYRSNDPIKDAEEVWAGTKFLIMEGCLGYETVGTARYSAFCYFTRPVPDSAPEEWPLQLCMNHNTAD